MAFHAEKAEQHWGVFDLPVPCTELPSAFQGRAPTSHTHTDTGCQPQFLHLIAIYLPVFMVVVPETAVISDRHLSGEAKLRVSFGNSIELSKALKDEVENLLIINFLMRFLATFLSCPSWKCYENIFLGVFCRSKFQIASGKAFILISERLK